jgi:hypothetical protein
MINFNTIVAIALSVLAGSSVDLDYVTSDPVEVNSVEKTNGVLIDDFTTEIWSWWTGGEGKYVLERTDDEMLKVKITDAGNPQGQGNGYHCFGRQFDGVDFSKTPVLKLKMKAEGGTPKVRIDVKDSEGMVTNAKSVTKTVTDKFVEYYYDFTGKFEQAWPDKQTVDPSEIVELLIFVNPGGPSFTGTLYIDDVSAVTVSEVPKQ